MESRLFREGTIPEWTTPEWYSGRERAPHLEQEGHKQRLERSMMYAGRAIRGGAKDVVDLGAGDGGLLSLIKKAHPRVQAWGYDLQSTNTEAARINRRVNVILIDVVRQPQMVAWGDLVIATEMLEHLIDPHLLVKRAFNSKAKWIIASSPANETLHNHYEFHTWAWDGIGYRKMIEGAGWEVVEQDFSTMCQVVLARKP